MKRNHATKEARTDVIQQRQTSIIGNIVDVSCRNLMFPIIFKELYLTLK
jgi:hypothetical protein